MGGPDEGAWRDAPWLRCMRRIFDGEGSTQAGRSAKAGAASSTATRMSRGKDEGSYNYVIFDEADVTIEARLQEQMRLRRALPPKNLAATATSRSGESFYDESDFARRAVEGAQDPHEAAREWLLAAEAQDGFEHVVIVDIAKNRVEAGSVHNPTGINFTDSQLAALRNPDGNIVIHHNHPSAGSLSPQDLSFLADSDGVIAVIAHGADGPHFLRRLCRPICRRSARSMGPGRLAVRMENSVYEIEDAARPIFHRELKAANVDSRHGPPSLRRPRQSGHAPCRPD